MIFLCSDDALFLLSEGHSHCGGGGVVGREGGGSGGVRWEGGGTNSSPSNFSALNILYMRTGKAK